MSYSKTRRTNAASEALRSQLSGPRKRDYDVAICGAGPVGLTLASKLALQGLSVVCLELSPGLCTFPRAVGMDDESARAFAAMGISAERLAPCVMDCAGIKYYGERDQIIGVIHPKQRPYGYFKGATFYQPFLEQILLERALELDVALLFGARVRGFEQDKEGVQVFVERDGTPHTLNVAYLVGCDGSHSSIRKQLGLDFNGTTFEQKWLIVDTENDVRAERYVESWCHSDRPTVSIPRRNGYRRWEFMLRPEENEADYQSLDKIWPLLKRYVAVDDLRIARKHVYTFHSRIASKYRVERVLLAGDAAHVMPPFMAQGLAAGIRDAENLGWKLGRVVKGELPESALDSYESERKPHVQAMMRLSERAGKFVMPRSRALSHLRDAILGTLQKVPGITAAIEEGLMRPTPTFELGLFMPESSHTGVMLPQPEVKSEAGKPVLLDAALGSEFSFVCFGSHTAPLSAAMQTHLTRLKCKLVQVVPQGLMVDERWNRMPGAELVEDVHNAFGAWLHGADARYFLVRPDKYVMCAYACEDELRVATWLDLPLGRLTAPKAHVAPTLLHPLTAAAAH